MELLSVKSIKKRLDEKKLAARRKQAERLAKQDIRPVCREDANGELINEIVVFGMPLFQVSNNEGRWNVKPEETGEVIKHLREACVENYMQP
jgi:hypothetical protein